VAVDQTQRLFDAITRSLRGSVPAEQGLNELRAIELMPAQAILALGEATAERETAQRAYDAAAERRRGGRAATDIQQPANRQEAERHIAQAEEEVAHGETQRNKHNEASEPLEGLLSRAAALLPSSQLGVPT
jgi:hypothetical protein